MRIAINGFGRIGRSVLRVCVARGLEAEIVAVNDLADAQTLSHLFAYDSNYGPLDVPVTATETSLTVRGHEIQVLSEREPAKLPWKELGIDVALESTGRFTKAELARAHLEAGAKKVLVSAPSQGADYTLVMGVNSDGFDPAAHEIISNASCTTNALAPLAQVLGTVAEIEHGFMSTVHAFTQDQNLHDGPHRDLRRARSAAVNVVPTTTGAAKAIGLVLPELEGKLWGSAIRVPIPVGSLVELSAVMAREVTKEAVLEAYRAAATSSHRGIIEYATAPLVSSDIVGNPASCVFDSGLAEVDGRYVKVAAWYDNEWAFSERTVDALRLLSGEQAPSPLPGPEDSGVVGLA